MRRDFKTARLLTLLLGFGEALEAWTRKKSLDSHAQSLALDVDTVWVRREGREMHVAISELSEDDLVIVRTGSAIPVDGGLTDWENEGRSSPGKTFFFSCFYIRDAIHLHHAKKASPER